MRVWLTAMNKPWSTKINRIVSLRWLEYFPEWFKSPAELHLPTFFIATKATAKTSAATSKDIWEDIFKATGAEAALRDAMTAYSEKAYTLLEKVPVISNRKKHLHDVADMLLKRDY